MSDLFAALSDDERELLAPAPAPKAADAMKAVLTDERFSDPDWIFERKLDGIRCIAIRSGKRVRLLSRNDLSLNARYPELVTALEAEACDRFAIDGEVVAFDGAQTSFARLAAARAPRRPGVPLRLRHPLARRPGRPRAAAARAQAAAPRARSPSTTACG